MFDARLNSKVPGKNWMILALTLGLMASATGLHAQKKSNKKAAAQGEETQQKRVGFDIRKIVWPNPPAIARIKFEAILTGQKIDRAALESKQKPKQSWMDRLAGAQPDSQVKDVQKKVGFQLIRVYGVAADSQGSIYAADQAVGAIFIFPGGSEPDKLELIKNGEAARMPMINGLAIDDTDRLFVTDAKLHHVLVFSAKHEPEASFGTEVLVSPAGIAIDNTNRFVYVVDTQQDQVLVFDADNYKLLRRMGTGGKKHMLTGPGNFALPTHVAVDREGNVYITDTLNDRVEIFDADGTFISEFGKPGDGPGHFARPKGITLDRDGHIWVVDEVQSRVQVFDKEGRLLIYFGERGWYPGQFQAVYAIAADNKNNRMITSEQFPGRVQVFRYVTDAEAAVERTKREAAQDKNGQKPADADSQKESTPRKAQGTGAP